MVEHAKDEKVIFLAALEQANASEREAYVQDACGGDFDLLKRVRELLSVHEETQGPLDAPPPGLGQAPTIDEPITERPGTVIGPYKLLEQIGEGGFGVVFMAEQQHPIRRKVALKVIKPGMDTRQVIGRFEAERQALALMDHPNIAKVLEAGTIGRRASVPACSERTSEDAYATVNGRPYFVMELVKGIPITEYCDQNQLTPLERLELFLHVCQAIQHAHQKGIIHRDIKPTNVLVTLQDGAPLVKVIDFGIAKAMGQQLTDKTLFTNFAQLIGTPLYMSPEQAALSNVDVDTRSDIYSLGVLLYEMLTGTTPFDKERFKEAGYDEIRRIIREEEPEKPSTRISTLGRSSRVAGAESSKPRHNMQSRGFPSFSPGHPASPQAGPTAGPITTNLATIAAQRKSDPKRLSLLFRGELDWIVMKCLEKDRNRRYESASAFAADVQRYLHDEPVLAGPPGLAYRLRKFVWRNRFRVAPAAAALLVLLAGIGGISFGLVRALAAEQKEREAKDLAQKRLGLVEKEIEIITSIFQDLDPREEEKGGLPLSAQLGERLDQAAKGLEGETAGDPVTVARLRFQLGNAQLGLGDPEKAVSLCAGAKQTLERELGPDHPDTLTCMNNLATAYRYAGRTGDAVLLHQQTLETRKLIFGPDHGDTLSSMNNLALAYQENGQLDMALPLYEEALAKMKAKPGADEADTLSTMNNLAGAYKDAGQFDKSIALHSQALEKTRAKRGPNHLKTNQCENDLAVAYVAAGRHDKSIPLLEQTLDRAKVKLGPDHPETLNIMNNLGEAYREADQPDKAIPLHKYTLERRNAKYGPNHPDTLNSMNSLGSAYYDSRQFQNAKPIFESAWEKGKVKPGPGHPATLEAQANVGVLYRDTGRVAEAIPLLEDALAKSRQLRPPVPAKLAALPNVLAAAYDLDRQFAKSEPLHHEALEQAKKMYNAGDMRIASLMAGLGTNLLGQKKYADAEPVLRECLALREKNRPDVWTTFNTRSQLGGTLLAQKMYADAEGLLESGYEGMKKRETKMPPAARFRLNEALERLVQLYDAWDKKDKAAEWRQKLEAAKKPKDVK